MAEYSRIASGVATSLTGGGIAPVNLPFIPNRIKFINQTAQATPTAGRPTKGYWYAPMGQGAGVFDTYGVGPVYTTASTASGGFYTYAAGNLLQFGAKQQVVAATTNATDPSFQVNSHGYLTGDVVMFQGLYQSATSGMPQICGIPFTITVVDANTFTINWNMAGSNYTSLTGSPAGATVMKVLFPSLYIPQVSFVNFLTLGATTQVQSTTPHHLKLGQQVAFRVPPVWGTSQLNSLPNAVIPGSPIYGYVVSVVDAFTVIVNINSASYTAFNANQPVASVSGLNFPQMVPVGDVNTGGDQIGVGTPLYPSPTFLNATGSFSTINGPAIQGAFVNNTSQGFVIGATLIPVAAQTIYWEAYLDDLTDY